MKGLIAARRVLALVLVSACGGSSPIAPSTSKPPAPMAPAAPLPVTLSGHLTATNGGQPLGGVSTSLLGQTGLTDGAGNFRYTLTPGTTNARLDLTGTGIVPRSLFVAIGSTRDVAINAIGMGGFDLTFYRALVRNGYEEPAALTQLYR